MKERRPFRLTAPCATGWSTPWRPPPATPRDSRAVSGPGFRREVRPGTFPREGSTSPPDGQWLGSLPRIGRATSSEDSYGDRGVTTEPSPPDERPGQQLLSHVAEAGEPLSEFERLLSDLKPVLGGRSPADLAEEAGRHEISLLAVCSWFDAVDTYLWLNLLLMNGIWLASVLYRRFVLAPNLT